MKLFPILNKAMLAEEGREAYASWDARVWPSEASAELLHKSESNIVGKCHRASFLRLIGWPISDKVDVVSARRFRTGRMIELDIVQLAKDAGVFVASGVRVEIFDEETGLNLPLELDLVVVDPATGQLGITENKTVYGYGAKKVIAQGEPKLEGVMQTLIYLNEFGTGKQLKQVILDCAVRKVQLETEIKRLQDTGADPSEYTSLTRQFERNRVDVDYDNLARGSDGPIWANMLYESRDDCLDREFEISLYIGDDGQHYPQIDGVPVKLFTLESVYERFQTLWGYHTRAKTAAQERLAARGIAEPAGTAGAEVWEYRQQVFNEIRSLPSDEFWPPAEYEFRYTRAKIDRLAEQGIISKTAYNKFVKGWKDAKHPGAWQCAFCNFKKDCVSREFPELAHLVADLNTEDDEEAA